MKKILHPGAVLISLLILACLLLSCSTQNRENECEEKYEVQYEEKMESIRDDFRSWKDLNTLRNLTRESLYLIRSWVLVDKIADTPDKRRLVTLLNRSFTQIYDNLDRLKEDWPEEDQELYKDIRNDHYDSLIDRQQYIMSQLNSFEAYDDPFIVFEVNPMVEVGGEIGLSGKRLLHKMDILLSRFYARLDDNMQAE